MRNSPQDVHNKTLGKIGEKRAVKYLKRAGYRILAANYRTPFGEADVVAKDGETVVFCEVKTRTGDLFGTPADAVGRKKRQTYVKIAGYYLMRAGEDLPVRFDVLEVTGQGINHIIGAFEG